MTGFGTIVPRFLHFTPARIATEQKAMGGFEHLEAGKTGNLKIDPQAAQRIHGKSEPKVHIETYGCQMNTKNTTKPRVPLIMSDAPSACQEDFIV